MRHFIPLVLFTSLYTAAALAQESHMPEFHGFATQSFLYSNLNNYLGMNTGSGSFDWTEAAVNINEQVTGNLRVGAQAHLMRLGQFGGSNVTLDWALADYRVREWFGVRAGKVKIRWGLYNDTQDADPGYLWSLLPEPVYAVDVRATDLAQTGVELYGRMRLGKKRGELSYSAYFGYYTFAPHDGYMETNREEGYVFSGQPKGKSPGFDLRWKTPVKGLTAGASLMMYNAKGNLYNGSYREPLTYWPTYYASYEKKKLFLSAQYVSLLEHDNYTIAGVYDPELSTSRSWFVMAGYHLTDKLQVGVYRTQYVLTNADESDPDNYFRDWVASSRFDFNSHWYAKLEGHFMDGAGLGFYDSNNPNGVAPRTRLVVAKVGFVF